MEAKKHGCRQPMGEISSARSDNVNSYGGMREGATEAGEKMWAATGQEAMRGHPGCGSCPF